MRLVDVTLSFPPILLAMAVAASLGPGLPNASVAMIIVWWPIYARLMRAQVLEVKSREHVEAAVAGGAGRMRVLLVHILPLCWTPTLVNATMDFGQVVLLAASLSFIGLGAVPPTPEWGSMISEGASNFYQWWIAAGPGLAILTVVLATSFLGDGLRDHSRPEGAGMSGSDGATPLLEIAGLTASFRRDGVEAQAVRGVDLRLNQGEVLGIVGESGSGKSVAMLALLQLLPPSARVTGSVRFRGRELVGMPADEHPSHPRPRHRLHLSGSADRPQSGDHHRRPDRRGDPAARSGVAPVAADAGKGPAGAGGDPAAGAAAAPVSPRILRRHAAAGDDRHGAGQPSRRC